MKGGNTMKKLLALLFMYLLICPHLALAQVDLSKMSYDELVKLKDQINLAIWESEDWQEVEVPQGTYQVGTDIPAGHWTITVAGKNYIELKYGSKLANNNKDIANNTDDFLWEILVSERQYNFDKNKDLTSYDIVMENGDFVYINAGTALFTPYSGKPDLGFNK